MKKTVSNTFIKVIKFSIISLVVLLAVLFIIPIIFPGKIAQEVKTFANERLEGELNFSEADLSFFHHFPSLTLTFDDFKLKGSTPFKKETLISANEIAFGINIKSLLFDSKVKIDKIYISGALINVKVNERGEANYNVYLSDDKVVASDTSSTSLRLDKITIANSRLIYNDKSTKILIDARGFNYVGKGDLDLSVFDIYTEAEIDSLDFSFDKQMYLRNKKVKADLITKINTNSLAFVFEQNNLKINKLPIEFTGKFDFLKNGYDLDFKITSKNSRLNDFFTALPPQYVTWLEKTKVKGRTDIALSLKGKYIASENKKPDMAFSMNIRNGGIEYKNAPFPVTDIFLNFDTQLPALDTEQLKINLDSLYFNVGKDYMKAIVKTNGTKNLSVDAKIKASMDLQKIDQAFGLQNMDLKGMLKIDIASKGKYNKDTNIFPITNGTIILKNAAIKTAYYPNPIQNIDLSMALSNGSGQFKDSKISINPASFVFEGKPFRMTADFQNFEDVNYAVKAKGEIDVAKVYQVFAKKGLDLKGYVKADVAFSGKQSDASNGNYVKLKNSGTLQLRDILTTSEYFPKPFLIKEGLFTFHQDKMNFSNFVAAYGQSDFKMKGYLQNVINYALSEKEILQGNFSLDADYINVDEFMSGVSEKPAAVSKDSVAVKPSGVVMIPSNLNLQFSANAKKIHFGEVNIENGAGNMMITQGQLDLKNTGFELIGCKMVMAATYKNESATKAAFDFKILAKDFDIKRAYDEIKMFREMASAAENAQGIVSLVYQVGGKLDDNMQPIYPSLTGGGTLSVKEVKLRGFKMFGAVGKETNNEGIENGDVNKVDIHTSVKNNIITIERFKFKFAGFRPRIEGTTSFDGQLNIKMRLGLPPLGIIGIPMTITGTKDNPKVKLGKKTEDLKETNYTDQVIESVKETH